MASEWIKCISAHDKSMSIYINMALATTVFAKGNGSRITFSGDPEDYTDVEESPETVISLVVDEKNADRT